MKVGVASITLRRAKDLAESLGIQSPYLLSMRSGGHRGLTLDTLVLDADFGDDADDALAAFGPCLVGSGGAAYWVRRLAR